jgi:hypothetical protein
VAPVAIQVLGVGVTALGVYLGSLRQRNNIPHAETLSSHMLDDPALASYMANSLPPLSHATRESTPDPETEPIVSPEDAHAMLNDRAFAMDMANGLAASLNLDRPSNDTGASSSRHCPPSSARSRFRHQADVPPPDA